MNVILKNFINRIVREIECPLCIKCGSYFVQENYFCRYCEKYLFENYFQPLTTDFEPDLSVASFLKWKQYESDSVSELVYLLKTKTSDLAWNWLTKQVEAEICESILPGSILIPVPGSATSFHTNHFCQAVQNLTGCESINALIKKNGQKHQKTLSAISRLNSQFIINEEFTQRLNSASHVCLIDDIVTTGATLKNISNAIRCSTKSENAHDLKIQGITMFYRTKQY